MPKVSYVLPYLKTFESTGRIHYSVFTIHHTLPSLLFLVELCAQRLKHKSIEPRRILLLHLDWTL